MNDDDLSDRLRRLVDRAHPVELDEVTHRHVTPARRPWTVALAGLAVIALVGGAVALLRVDRDEDAPAVTTSPTTIPAPTTTLPAPTTTVPSTTVPVADDGPTEFVGVTTDGRLVVVDVATGQEVRELARLGDPRTPATPEDPIPPNHIESVEVVAGDPAQVLYGDCCEPAVGNVFAIGIDGSPTTVPIIQEMGGDYVLAGTTPDVNADGEVALYEGSLGVSISDLFQRGGRREYLDSDDGGGIHPAWLTRDLVAFEGNDDDGLPQIGIVDRATPDDAMILDPEGEAVWTNPVGYLGQVLVAEQCCGRFAEEYDQPATGRIVDAQTGGVVASFPYDGIVVDQDVAANTLLVTYLDGRVARIDPETGEQTVLATGFIAASW